MEAALFGRLTSSFTQGSFGFPGRFIRIDSPDQGPQATVSDRIDLGSAARSPLKVLNSEVLSALDKALKEDGMRLDRQADPADFTPQQVADRILGVIDATLSQYAVGDPRRTALLEKARAGVERAFEAARGILDGLGVLQGELADSIARTRELIQGGLERLSGDEPAAVSGAGDTPSSDTAVQQVALGAVSYSTSQVTSLVIDTVEGDRITIDISKQASVSQAGVLAQSDAAQVQGFQSSRNAGVTFSFSVQGELNADEQKAVDALLKRIDKVSEGFFKGNVQDAFARVASLKFDSEELAGFALDLKSTESYRAVAAYQQTASADAAAPAPGGSLQDAAGFGADIRGLFDAAAANTRFAEPARDVARLFGIMTDERATSGVAVLKDQARSMLRDLVSAITAGYTVKVDSDDAGQSTQHDEELENETGDN